VQIAVLGALRNLSYRRANKESKLQIAGDHGLPEIMLALQMSRVPEMSVYVCAYVCVCNVCMCMSYVCVCRCVCMCDVCVMCVCVNGVCV